MSQWNQLKSLITVQPDFVTDAGVNVVAFVTLAIGLFFTAPAWLGDNSGAGRFTTGGGRSGGRDEIGPAVALRQRTAMRKVMDKAVFILHFTSPDLL